MRFCGVLSTARAGVGGMPLISFKNATTLTEIEEASAKLDAQPDSHLRLPTSLKNGGGVAIPASLIQFAAKWARSQQEPTLRLHSSSATESGLRELAQEPYGISALYFAPFIELSQDERVSTKAGLELAVDRVKAMQSGRYLDTMHGRGAFLACFAGAKNEFLYPLYSRAQEGSLRGREDFLSLTEQLIQACAPSALRKLPQRHLNAVANLVYELFRNTDEHARRDEEGNDYRRNVRGVLAKYISYSSTSVADDVSAQDSSLGFFILRSLANQQRHEDNEGNVHASSDLACLELTVFDTGPGLAKHWLSQTHPGKNLENLDIEQEEHLVRKCFEQHSTTKYNHGSGQGLSLVLNSLSELKAYLRLRTGRICLVQDFSSSASTTFAPRHWLKENHKLALVPGAAYSVIIPISRGKN